MVDRKKSGAGTRVMKQRVKTAKGRKIASTIWLERQLNDPYVHKAKQDGYRSRAAYKILDLQEQYKLFKPGMRVVDLGAAPGGWTQVVGKICGATAEAPKVVAVDRQKRG